uniref:Uncharacterized protein n=1 Tax=Sus scrofa TaxID=9823 RepID=A0A8D1VGI6_PIG
MMAILTCVRGYLIILLTCISLIISNVEHFFHVFFGYLSLEKCLLSSSAHFFDWVVFLILSCMSCYILEINPLSVASFANIFSHSVGCLFVLWFTLQKLLNLVRSHFFMSVFIFITLGGGSEEIAAVYVRVFGLCFPLRVLEYLVLYLGP